MPVSASGTGGGIVHRTTPWIVAAVVAAAVAVPVAATPSTPTTIDASVRAALARTDAEFARLLDGATDAPTATRVAQARANIATAGSIIDTLDAGGDPLRMGVEVAKRVTAAQAAALDVTLPAHVGSATLDSPAAAAATLMARHGVRADATQRAALAELDSLTEPLRGALTRVIDAFLAFEVATEVAFAAGPDAASLLADGPAGPDALTRAGVDLGGVFAARTRLLDAVSALRDALTTAARTKSTLGACPAVAVDLAGVDDVYDTDCALVIDAHGDDLYRNNAGGGRGAAMADGLCGAASIIAAAAVVDVNGDDEYVSGRSCGVNGGGALGAGMLVDIVGNDRYTAAGSGTNGGGALGAGLLVDVAGADTYTAEHLGTNGGGFSGSGLLVDVVGADTYLAGGNGTNGGGYGGHGTLIDAEGDDYRDATTGANGGANIGGIGLLLDNSGRDVNNAYLFAGNGAGSLGVGLLVDSRGTGDVYGITDTATYAQDETIVPKQLVGAQVDAESPAPVPPLPPVDDVPVPTVPPSAPPNGVFVSDDCDTGGTNVVTGFVGDAYVKARHKPVANGTLVCVAAEAGAAHLGGRLTVTGVSVGTPVAVDQDGASVAACAANPNNVRLQNGTVGGGQPYWLDVTPAPAGSTDAAWVCVRLTNSVGLRLRLTAGQVTGTSFAADPAVPHTPAYAAPAWPSSGPSALCGVESPTRVVAATVGTTPVAFSIGSPSYLGYRHVCLRAGGAGGAGGRLTLDTAASPGVSGVLTTTDSTSPCSFDVLTGTSPVSYGIFLSNPAALPNPPASACVSVAGFALGATLGANGPATVAWYPDPA